MKMYRGRIRLFLPVILVFTLAVKAYAEDVRPVFVIMQQDPYAYIDNKGDTAGYLFTIANMILKEAGYPENARIAPIKRMISDVASGAADCTIAASSPFARKTFTQVEPIGHMLSVGIMPRKGIVLSSYEDLKGLRIGVPSGMSIGDPFDSDATLNKVVTPDYEKSSLMLAYGRIDAIMGATESIRFSAYKKAGILRPIFGEPLVTQKYPKMLMCNKDLPGDGYVLRLKEATQRLKAGGEIQDVIRDFFSFKISERTQLQ
ncbi:ABC transporter substrate-binding protein [Labrenzia sp. PHM005]|uniref:substrate-binding periplasmic protein n=1 Tax=Labrenzia sp. PHM005 TaxID=2590016 RepID=UPI001140837E|nr:transporter substrate-binding domain-containing protein [Labrenzia sp. PHM005]QDG79082.1 amino acid ABC transporter substrate-binding protein [Labrenzia sp. PHM005]